MTKLENITKIIKSFNNAVIVGTEKQGAFTNLYFQATTFAKEGIEEKLNDYAFRSHNNLMIEKNKDEYFFTFINR